MNYKLEIKNGNIKLIRPYVYEFTIYNEDDEWFYYKYDIGGNYIQKLDNNLSNWVDEEYNKLIREKKLKRILEK